MRICFVAALAAALCVSPAHAFQLEAVDGGALPARHGDDHLSAAQEAELLVEVRRNQKRLGLAPTTDKTDAGLRWPLRLDAGVPGVDRISTFNFVDLNPAFPNQLRDYQCGTRTYDTAQGYNHRGTDLSLWPFSWQTMAQEAVDVVAAAAGTIVLRRDGNFDRNCSFNVPDTPNLVFVQHDDGTIGWYLHLKSGSVTGKQVGERVEVGEYLGKVGSSGISTGPHLHFELRANANSNAAVIDPYSGQCNTVASRWQQQPEYEELQLESVAVHDAPPEFYFNDCARTESPHHQRWLRPAQTFYVAAYYGGQRANTTATIVLRDPNGVEMSRTQHTPTQQEMGRAYLSASYWYFRFTVPANAAPGVYSTEVSYQGRTETARFAVGGPIYAASGAWYEPSQSGHGLITEVVDLEGSAYLTATWFMFHNGQPRWLFGIGPISGNSARVPVQISSGAKFPPQFDGTAVHFEDWGVLNFEFDSLEQGRVDWNSSYPGFENGSLALSRLATPADINLDDFNSGMRACASGSWYVPEQSGHGLQLQVIDVGGSRQLLVAWYVYVDGVQTWLTGIGPIIGKQAVVNLELSQGGQFPPAFAASDVQSQPWGSAYFELLDSQRMRVQWDSTVPGFGEGSLELQRLTTLLTAQCL